MRNKIVLSLLLFLLPGAIASSETPELTARFANPMFDCDSGTYCVDVELQSDLPDQQLYGMNVRFFYDAEELWFLTFDDFQGGYGPSNPNPPIVATGSPASGPNLFSFAGAAEYVNGAVQLLDPYTDPVYIATDGWTKVFSACFEITDPDILLGDSFCPTILWDLQVDVEKGGFLRGSSGVVTTALGTDPTDSKAASTNVILFNGAYAEETEGPSAYPTDDVCLVLSCSETEESGEGPEDDVVTVPEDIEIEDTDPVPGDETSDVGTDLDDETGESTQSTPEDTSEQIEGEDESPDEVSDQGISRKSPADENKDDADEAEPLSESVGGCQGNKRLIKWLSDFLLIGVSLSVLASVSALKRRF